MNVLLLTQEYPPETTGGGIGIANYNLARALARAGHRVHVLASAVPSVGTTRSQVEGVSVHRIRRRKFELPVLRRLWFNYFPWTKHQWEYMYSVAREIESIIRSNDIDIIEAPEIWAEGLLYSFRRRVPIMIKLQGPLFLLHRLNRRRETLDWRAVEWIDGIWTKRADHIISISAALAEVVSKEYGIEQRAMTIIPNPVDIERFHAIDEGSVDDRTVLYVGRIEPRKGVLTLAEAIPEVLAYSKHVRFQFIGRDVVVDGVSTRARVEAKLRAAGVLPAVTFFDHVSNADLPRYYQQSTVCVFPSRWEPQGIVCLEAMACAKPVIASAAGGMAEIVRNCKDGLLVPPDNSAALAQSILELLNQPERARQIGQAARRRVESDFSSEVVAARSLELYQKVIQQWKFARANA